MLLSARASVTPVLQKKKKKEKTDVAPEGDTELPPLKIGGK